MRVSECPVTVNYDEKLEILLAFLAMDCDRRVDIDPNVTSENFPSKKSGTADIVIKLVCPEDRNLSTEEIIDELDRMGLRPAKPHELLSGTETYKLVAPEARDIIALGAAWEDPEGDNYVVGVYPEHKGCDVFLYQFVVMKWPAYFIFAAVNKSDRSPLSVNPPELVSVF